MILRRLGVAVVSVEGAAVSRLLAFVLAMRERGVDRAPRPEGFRGLVYAEFESRRPD